MTPLEAVEIRLYLKFSDMTILNVYTNKNKSIYKTHILFTKRQPFTSSSVVVKKGHKWKHDFARLVVWTIWGLKTIQFQADVLPLLKIILLCSGWSQLAKMRVKCDLTQKLSTPVSQALATVTYPYTLYEAR